MRAFIVRIVTITALMALAGCASGTPTTYGVEQAYETSGLINVPPYTRTIFSGTNF